MVGRGSRKRGVCEGILYNIGTETSTQIMERLKKQNVVALQDLERVLKIFQEKPKDQKILKALREVQETGQVIRNLGQLKLVLSEDHYNKLIRGMI